ncbi:snaclec A10 [Ditylenchus destructor]|uniref:Snaclec A10 n=1 Tax=Ditylenchus destructor TaxID=166010 RepID=A0AAD4MSR1_9BILA|nr:snaclec A10 [Ditylenchus destructor]
MFAKLALFSVIGVILIGSVKPCKTGWSGIGNRCFRLINHVGNWTMGLDVCRALGGGADYASIHSSAENQGAIELLSGNFAWFGLRRVVVSQGVHKKTWSDGSPVDYLGPYLRALDGEEATHCYGIDRQGLWAAFNCASHDGSDGALCAYSP